MHKKALTVAIAGALAAPMAAQAVDFTISGHVNRALFLYDLPDGSKPAEVSDNGESVTRIRANGSTELGNGNTVGIQFEYGAGSEVSLRHANLQYSGAFGRVTLGQGSEAGDSSQYSDMTGVFGIGHGKHGGQRTLGDYFGSLDSGARIEMIRYDTPSFGPISAAVSLSNGDRDGDDASEDALSGRIGYTGEFGDTSLGAQLAVLREEGDRSTYGGSIGAAMPSGLTFSGAWAKGKNMDGQARVPGTPEMDMDSVVVECPDPPDPRPTGWNCRTVGGPDDNPSVNILRVPAESVTPATPATPATDPSYWQAQIGYVFGNSAVAVSWYHSKDFIVTGSKGRAIGIGARHTIPRANAEVYLAMQQYNVSGAGASNGKETVYMVGSRIQF